MVDDIRAPAAWRRPKTKIYDYNQDMGCAYYKVWAILNFFLVLLIILVSNIEMFGFSPWSTMWTQKSDRESFLSDRWVSLFFFFFDQWVSFFLFLLTLEFLGKHQITKKSCPTVLGGPKFCDLWYFARPSKSTFPLKYIYSDIFISFIFPDRESPPSPPCGAGHDEPWGWVSNYFPINQQQQQTIKNYQRRPVDWDRQLGTFPGKGRSSITPQSSARISSNVNIFTMKLTIKLHYNDNVSTG